MGGGSKKPPGAFSFSGCCDTAVHRKREMTLSHGWTLSEAVSLSEDRNGPKRLAESTSYLELLGRCCLA